ncbi:MAG: LamG domain-containing protein, partial [Kiritimatiellae bacterium]|nr:LamG domain-containing protein [Kiritimatiellia bacterium]
DAGPGTLRVAWRKAEGPGAAYFDDASLAATRVAFTAAGTYVLEVTADDGLASAPARQTVTVSGTADDACITNGLVHHWTLDAAGGAGVGKDLVGGRDLTLYNGATVEAEGYAGYGARFNAENASAQTEVWDYPSNMADAISATCWVYEDTTESYYGTARVGRLLSYHTDLEIQHNKETPSYFQVRTKYVKDNGGTNTVCWFFAAPSVPIANRWAHVAVTASLGATSDPRHAVKLYIDGAEMALTKFQFPEGTNIGENSAQPSYPGTATDRARIFWGCANGQYRVFPGVIDEMRIYNRILSAAEVQALAAGGAFLNRAPQVSLAAGMSLRTTVDSTVTIDPGVYDDGLPLGSTPAGKWSLAFGEPSNVTMPDSGNDFTFAAVGQYGLVYTVTDGERTTVSPTVRVEVVVDGTMLFIR